MSVNKKLWTEKYRPQTFDDLILPERIKNKLKKSPDANYIFYGSPGTGKSSTAKILIKDSPSMWINASKDTSVDDVRNKIYEFCSTLSIMNGERTMKYVVFDEIEGVSDQYFKALRGTIEQFANTTRFIATTNYIVELPDALKDRFTLINFDFSEDEEVEIKKQYYKRVYNIIKLEGMSIEKDALFELVNRKFPSLRAIITLLQDYYFEDKVDIKLDDLKSFHGSLKDLYEHIFDTSKTEIDTYKFIGSNYSNRVNDVILALGTDFIEYIELEKPNYKSILGQICYEVNLHSYQSRFALDPLITVLSLIYKLKSLV